MEKSDVACAEAADQECDESMTCVCPRCVHEREVRVARGIVRTRANPFVVRPARAPAAA